METFTSILNTLSGLFTIGALGVSLVIVISLVSKTPPPFLSPLVRFLGDRALFLSFVVVLAATLGSLVYSDILGYEPCKLCWFQRIFIYPQVVIFGLALWKKGISFAPHGLALSLIGGLIAVYQQLGQLGINPFGLECLAVDALGSCAKNYVLQFGFISIPTMSLSVFVVLGLLQVFYMRKEKGSIKPQV